MTTLVEDLWLDGKAHARGVSAPMLNTSMGSQLGFATDQRQWVRNAAYIARPMIPILLQAPRGFEYLPNAELRRAILREMVEASALEITGVNGKLSIATDSTPFGWSGEVMEEVVNVPREPSKPAFTWYDRYNRSAAGYWDDYIRNLMMDEETKVAGLHSLTGDRPTDHLPDLHTFSMAFLEPDPTMKKVVRGVVCTNMMPTDAPDNTMTMAKQNNMQLSQFTIPFSAISSSGLGVNNILQSLLDGLSIVQANPQYRASFIKEIAPDVIAQAQSGFIASANRTREQQINVA